MQNEFKEVTSSPALIFAPEASRIRTIAFLPVVQIDKWSGV
jgi:hypothetical protein